MLPRAPLASARVLVVGSTPVVHNVLEAFENQGVPRLGTLSSSLNGPPGHSHISKDPQEAIESNPSLFEEYDLVVALDQPRPFEVALSELFAPKDDGTEKPMVISRSLANNCKMRCQYRELQLQNGEIARFVGLTDELLPWTEEKKSIVARTANSALSSNNEAYLMAAAAFVRTQRETKAWPSLENLDQVKTCVNVPSHIDAGEVDTYITKLCTDGLGSLVESKTLLAHLIVSDGIRLLTGSSQPMNNTCLEDAIELAAM